MPRAVRLVVIVLALAAGAGLSAPAGRAAGTGAPGPGPELELYRITAAPAAVARLQRAGYDVAATRPDGTTEVVLGPAELARLTAAGLHPVRWRDGRGRSVEDIAADQAVGPSVWRRWDGPGGLHAEIDALAAAHPDLVTTEVIGHSVEGRDIVAVRVTAGAPRIPAGARPAVLYISLQHAREWISGEVTRRLLHSAVETYGTDPDTTKLLDTTELWFLPAANPDGYERTFTAGNRLWRKNTRDNDGDGTISASDGVDINRNLPDHWGFTPEGSSDIPADQSYRGRAAASEPETQALMALAERLRFRFIVNYHSFGRLLLYPIGWQEQTPTADQAIYEALAGTPINPAIPGYTPELSAALYSTNGETSSWAHARSGTLAFTVELGEGAPGSGFLFPDNEALVAQEYELNRPFALDVARSAADPSRPVSHLGNEVPAIAADAFAVSYGDPQPVQATVLRRLGPVTVHWQVNGGPEQKAPATEWAGGLRYGATGAVWEHRVRGSVTGARPGDTVKVWFSAGGETGGAFTYREEEHRGTRVLVVAGGEHGRRPGTVDSPAAPPAGPAASAAPGQPAATGGAADRLAAVRTALAANGIEADTYDVDAHDRLAPDPLGVLGHYAAVVWTADDAPAADSPDPRPGPARALPGVESVSRLANDEMLALRDYLNQGGRLLYTGRDAGRPYMAGAEYDPVADGPCVPQFRGPAAGLLGVAGGEEGGDGIPGRCRALTAEFFQYWLGAYENGPAEARATGSVPPVDGVRTPFDGLGWAFAPAAVGPGRAAAAYTATGEAIGRKYPGLAGETAARYRESAGATDPGASRFGPTTAAAIETPATLLFGFGFEDVATPAERAQVMGRAVRYLLAPR